MFLIQTSKELKIRERTTFSTTLERDQDIEKDIVPNTSLNLHSSKQTIRGQQSCSFKGMSSERLVIFDYLMDFKEDYFNDYRHNMILKLNKFVE